MEGVGMYICSLYGGNEWDGRDRALLGVIVFVEMGWILTFISWKHGNTIPKENVLVPCCIDVDPLKEIHLMK